MVVIQRLTARQMICEFSTRSNVADTVLIVKNLSGFLTVPMAADNISVSAHQLRISHALKFQPASP